MLRWTRPQVTAKLPSIRDASATAVTKSSWTLPGSQQDFRWNATFTWSKNENRILSHWRKGADENQLISSIGSVSIIGRVGELRAISGGYKLVSRPGRKCGHQRQRIARSVRRDRICRHGLSGNGKPDCTMNFLTRTSRLASCSTDRWEVKCTRTRTTKMTEQGKLQHTLNGRLPGTEFYMSKDDPRIAAAGLSPQDGMYMIAPGTVKNDDGTYSPNTKVVTVESYYKEYYRMANVETNTFDTSFLKLREMRLEYKLPNSTLKKTPFSKASVALYARNLFCITDYPLFDPESAALNGSSMVTGGDGLTAYGTYFRTEY